MCSVDYNHVVRTASLGHLTPKYPTYDGATMSLIKVLQAQEPEVDLTRAYDAIVIGSGAAGGMAAHVLTSQGLKVLLLEAGKKLDINKELKSMEWPYEHPRRGAMPPDREALTMNEYTIRQPPYAASSKFNKVHSNIQSWNAADYSKNIVVDEKEHPYTGTRYAWVRARALGGKTNIWGRLALRLSDYDFKAKSRDGFGEDWPISYADIAPYYDRVDQYLGISGVKENLPHLPDSLFQRPNRLTKAEVTLRGALKGMGRLITPYRAGVTTDGLKHNKYRSKCFGRGACSRRVGGCDIHAAFDSPTGLIYPAMDTGNLTLRTNATAREILVDPDDGPGARCVLRGHRLRPRLRGSRSHRGGGGLDPRVGAPVAAVEVTSPSERHRQLERTRRPQLL